jgi:Tfp pilus assembly protein PilF
MVLLGDKMNIGLLDEEIDRRAEDRGRRYRDRMMKLDSLRYPSVTNALARMFERSEGWFAWHQKAQLEMDIDRRDAVYRQGLDHLPLSAKMHNAYGVHLRYTCNDIDKATQFFERAVELDPSDGVAISNLATIAWEYRGDFDAAEKLYDRLMELEPDHVSLGRNYAEFLTVQRRFVDAEKQLRTVIQRVEAGDDAMLAGCALLDGMLCRLMQKDDSTAIRRIRECVEKGIDRRFWRFDCLLSVFQELASAEDYSLYLAIADWIVDPEKVPSIDALLQARAIAAHKGGAKPAGKQRRRTSPSRATQKRSIRRINKGRSPRKK